MGLLMIFRKFQSGTQQNSETKNHRHYREWYRLNVTDTPLYLNTGKFETLKRFENNFLDIYIVPGSYEVKIVNDFH